MAEILRYSQKDLEIVQQEILHQGHFALKRVTFRHKLFSGEMSGNVVRELLVKGAAAVLIAYDPRLDNVVLIEQVRIGAYDPNGENSPWLLELVAGMVDTDETPAEVAMREAKEEAGLNVQNVTHAFSVWDSPGGAYERLHFFFGEVDSQHIGGVYGLAEENEDILVHVVSREQAYRWIAEGKIDNVLTVLGLQWLQLHYQQYR